MNAIENWYCSTSFWRWMTRERLLPFVLGHADLGDHLLEIGSGPGAATPALRKRARRVTSLDYDHVFTVKLAQSNSSVHSNVVQGDAAALPFADRTFSSAVAILVLHHLHSADQQDRAFTEIHRVLEPGGHLFAFEIENGWFHRLIHTNSTFTPLDLATLPARLTVAGFTNIAYDRRPGGFRLHASRSN
jgi:ubiquinone/menaquinone biosynthesis C-methylase UbiE